MPYARPVKFDNRKLLADESRVFDARTAGRLRVAVGYPNSYHVGMSSLAFQWVAEISSECDDVGVERFFADSMLSQGVVGGPHIP